MEKRRILQAAWPVTVFGLLLCGVALRAQDFPASDQQPAGEERLKPPFRQATSPAERRGLLEAWKEKRARERGDITPLGAPVAANAVGRASLVINSSGTVFYTRQLAGGSCDLDPSACPPNTNCPNWAPTTPYSLGTVVLSTGGVFDAYAGLLFQVTKAGTSGSSEPSWPILAGGTVGDGSVTWKAIGFNPATLVGCTPMEIVSRASGGAETVLAAEADFLSDGTQLSGWAEFLAANDSGLVAFKAEQVGRSIERDEGVSVIMTAGPGAGNLKRIADSPITIGGHNIFGYSSMVAMNNAGQIVFDGYGPFNIASGKDPVWQASHLYFRGNHVRPTSGVPILDFAAVAPTPFFPTGGTSAGSEPVWPTTIGQKVIDGGVTWQAVPPDGDENNHTLIRFTSGPGNQVLIGQGDAVPPSFTVDGFGNDDNSGASCAGCAYNDFDGRINSLGHVPVVITSVDLVSKGVPGQVAYLLLGPGSRTEAARSGGAGPGGVFGTIFPRININDSDQMLFVADVGGVKKLLRWTPPSTFDVVATIGDDIGTRSGGSASGVTILDIGYYADINNPGNVVFQATLEGGPDTLGYFFWDTTTGLLTTVVTGGDYASSCGTNSGGFFGLASEVITLADNDVAAFINGSCRPEETTGAAEATEIGAYLWDKIGGTQKIIASGDVVLGQTVTTVYAQHPSFVKRQLNPAGCAALRYYISLQPGDSDEEEGSGGSPLERGTPPGGQLIVACTTVCPTITVNPASLPGGTTGVPYSQTITQSGGAPPATFAITSGTQPTGLNLASSTGKLTGTPTAAGTFNFDVTATDKNGCTGTRSYSITIVCPTITLSPSTLPNGTVNVPYSQTITQSGGATPVTFAITSGAQPTGTNLSASGTLSGTPTATGPFTFDVTATDKNGCTGVHTYTVTINPCIPFEGGPSLSINPSSAHVGDLVKLTWTSIMSAGQGNYLVQRSVGGGPFSTIATVPASNALTMTFSFNASNPTGTQTFQVVAVLICDPTGPAASNQVTLAVSAAVTPPTCKAPPAPAGLTVSPNPVIPGQGFTLSWQAASGADHYNVAVSTDGGAIVTSLGFVYVTSFTSTAPSTATGTIIFYVSSVAICGTAGTQTSVSVPVGQACVAPEPVTNITVQAFGVTPPRPPSPTEYILVSWTPSATGTKPTRYSVRINGDPEIFVIGTSVVLPPRGTADPITAFVTPFGCAALTSAETFDPASSSWSTTGNLGLPRQEHTATLLSTGKVLVAGGVPNLFSPPSPTAELFDPALNQWTPTGTLATPRAEQAASALGGSAAGTATGTRLVAQVGSQVLVEGGTGTSLLASSELYDATAGTWSGVGNLANARDLHTATVLQDGRVLVAGGLASGPLASAEIYDPTTKVWTSTGSLATARYHHTATLLSNGKVLVAGGFGDAGALASAELFDPTAGAWTATGSLATARQAHSAALLSSGKVLVEGGDDGTNPIASSELYDPAAGTWSATGALIAARRNHTSTVLADGTVLVAGGFGTDLANSLKSSELYNPTAGTFSTSGALKGAHGFHSATLLANGKVLVAGAADKLGIEQVGTTADSGPIALFLSPPVASFTVSANPQVGAPVTFTDTSSPQATSWLWIFDEGTADDPDPTKRLTSTLQSPTHVYVNAGTHQVTLVASNGAGSSNATQSFSVAAASSVNRIVVSHTVQFDMTDPTRRRVAIQLTGPNNALLTLNTSETSETIVFLRFLDPGGKLVAERRLSVQPGSPAVYDLGAYGFTGRFSIELVSAQQFSSTLTVRGRSVREIHR